MKVTNLTSDEFVLSGFRLEADAADVDLSDVRYVADSALRIDINTLTDRDKISIVDSPDGFPLRTDEEREIALGLNPLENPNGGSQAVEWLGPFAFDHTMYDPDLGGGWDGIVIPGVVIPSGSFLLSARMIVDETFDNASFFNVYVGTFAGDEIDTSSGFSTDAASYPDTGVSKTALGRTFSNAGSPSPVELQAIALIEVADLVVWIDDFAGVPTTGSGRLWFEIATATAPS